MRAGAASDESFGADGCRTAWLHPGARVVTVQKRVTRTRPFSYFVKRLRLIRVEAPCEYRAFSEGRHGKRKTARMSPRKPLPLVGYTGNGGAHDERNWFDGGGNQSGGSSRDSPCGGMRRRADLRTGTGLGDDGRFIARSARGRGGSDAA